MHLKVSLSQSELNAAILAYIQGKGYNVTGAKVDITDDGGAEVSLYKPENKPAPAAEYYR